MMTIYLARHGQTEENLSRIFQGHLPGRLTAEGKEQARILGVRLQNIAIDMVVSSDLQRCKDTVQLAVGERQLPWVTTPLLREIDWGSWTGLYIKDVDLICFPADVETEPKLYDRAAQFLQWLKQNYDGRRILVVGHGLINRAVQAHIEGIPLQQLRSVPKMNNAELRTFTLENP